MSAQNFWPRAKIAIKLIVGAALIYYVFRSKMVDFQMLRTVLLNPTNLLISLVFLSFSAVCCATRWYLLVRAQGLSLSFKSLIELTMIGNFFNTFMPGAVGGDLIKAWYVAGREPKRKTRAIFTVLLDRGIGLSVIVFYSAATLLCYTEWIEGRPQLSAVAIAIWSFTAASLVLGLLFFSSPLWRARTMDAFLDFFRRWKPAAKIIDAALTYRSHLGTILLAVMLSASSVFGTNLYYKIQGNALGIEMGLAQYFFIVPLAITVSAVPLLPGGIGVGQVAFFTLFKWMGMRNPEQGSTLCTLMQVYTLLFNCLGAYFYVKFKRHPGEVGEAMAELERNQSRETRVAFVPEPG